MRTESSLFGASTRNRVLVIIGVIALSLWIVYPVQDSLKLGLDLNGGVQLVLRVKADEALLRNAARGRHARRDRRAGAAHHRAPGQRARRRRAGDRALHRSRSDPGASCPASPTSTRAKTDHQVDSAAAADAGRRKDRSRAATRRSLAYNNALPPDLEILPGQAEQAEPGNPLFYVVQRAPALTGNDLRSARQSVDEFNRPAVGFTLKPDAARRFGTITRAQHQPPARDGARQPRHVGRDASSRASTITARSPASAAKR